LAAVEFTANFEANLQQIAVFWTERQAPHAYVQLLDALDQTVIGNLERHPRIGRRFFERSARSIEARERVSMLLERFPGADVREYLSGDYLLLYGVAARPSKDAPRWTVHLLAIRHQRQLSFDLDGFWPA
jgi:plasmid stabilization system protein ParE